MAVYTSINKSELEDWLKNFLIGPIKDFKGISSGVTNTNYLISTEPSKFILTIFEGTQTDDLPFFFNLMNFLSNNDFPCQRPIENKKNSYLTLIKDKPAVLVSFLSGTSKEDVNIEDCYSVGLVLAKFHDKTKNFSEVRVNNRGIDWISDKFNELKKLLSESDQRLIELEISYQIHSYQDEIPKGIIHGDLFRDNVFFSEHKLSAVIDFYYACNDQLLLDIAITINDWCSDINGVIQKDKFKNFLEGYQSIRVLEDLEWQCLNNAMRGAALRFWVSRLDAYHNIVEGEIISIKDPNYFKKVLLNRQAL